MATARSPRWSRGVNSPVARMCGVAGKQCGAYAVAGRVGSPRMIWRSAATSCSATGTFRIALVGLLTCGVDAFAAHPLLTEDTGTQGAGKLELELEFGNARTHAHGDRLYEFGPQLSYGMLPNLDAIVRPAWLHSRSSSESGTQRGRLHAQGAAARRSPACASGTSPTMMRAPDVPCHSTKRSTRFWPVAAESAAQAHYGRLSAACARRPSSRPARCGWSTDGRSPPTREGSHHALSAYSFGGVLLSTSGDIRWRRHQSCSMTSPICRRG